MNKKLLSTLAGVVGLSVASQAAVVIDFGVLWTGSQPAAASGGNPILRVNIADAGANTVNVSVTFFNTVNPTSQFLDYMLLNMSPYPGSPGIIESSTKIDGASFNQNGINDAGLVFDAKIDFNNSNSGGGANRLKPGDAPLTFQLTGTGLDETAFNALSSGNGAYQGLIHINGIGASGQLSGKLVPVPEPATMLAFAPALFLMRRRRKVR